MSSSGMSAAVSALPVNTEEHRAMAIMAELYSGFVNEKKVAKDLAALSTPVERLEEILKYRLHPALYTQLVWNGTGFESQQALTSQQVEEKLAASTDYDNMNIVTRFASDKIWNYGLESTWAKVREEIVAIRRRQQTDAATGGYA